MSAIIASTDPSQATAVRRDSKMTAVGALRSRLLLAFTAAILFTALTVGTVHGAAAWLPAQNVLPAPVTSIRDDQFFNRKALDVASDAAGDSLAVWIEEHPKIPGPGTECQAMWAERPAGGSFSAPQGLTVAMPFCVGQIKLAMNAAGTAIVAWRQGTDIDVAIRQPGGVFGSPTTLSASAATDDPWVSINDAGVAAASWDDTSTGTCPGLTAGVNWALHVSVRQPGDSFGPFETVCDTAHVTGPTIFTPRIAVDAQGDIVATWVNSYFDGSHTHDDVEWAYRPVGGSFTGSSPHVFASMLDPVAPSGSFAADVGFDSAGRATAIWPDLNGTNTVIQSAARPPGAATLFGASSPVSDEGASGSANSPRLAIDPSTNTAIAVWVRCPSSCQVEAAARPSGGGFQTPQPLSAAGATSTFGPVVGLDPSGDAFAAWSGPSPQLAGTQVQIARRPQGSGQLFEAVTPISTEDRSESPAIAFDGQGNAIAIWEHRTTAPAGQTIQYAGYDAAPPQITAVSVPNGLAGQSLAFSASAFDRWSQTTLTWNFGDGVTASGSSVSHTYSAHGRYTLTVTATDAVGNSSSQQATVVIGCAPPAAGKTLDANCNQLSTPRPLVTHLTQAHSSWREGHKLASLARAHKHRAPIGTTFSFDLNTAAQAKLIFSRTVSGRAHKGRCLAPSPRNSHGRRCRRTITAGTLTFNAHAATNKVSFQGRLSHSKILPPGRYTLKVIASNSSGTAASPTIAFTILRR